MKILIVIDFRPRLLRAWARGQKTQARRWAWDFELHKWEDQVRQKWVPDLEALGQYLSRKTQARRWAWNFEVASGRPSEAEICWILLLWRCTFPLSTEHSRCSVPSEHLSRTKGREDPGVAGHGILRYASGKTKRGRKKCHGKVALDSVCRHSRLEYHVTTLTRRASVLWAWDF